MNFEEYLNQGIRLLAKGLARPISFGIDHCPSVKRLIDELDTWNQKVNLTSITKREEVLEKHCIDSLAPLPFLQGKTVIDLGSGAGFPGLPLAIADPERDYTLVEATRKKVNFIDHCIQVLGLKNCRAVWAHLPDKKVLLKVDAIVSRGTFSSRDFLRAALPSWTGLGPMILMKGKVPVEELKQVEPILRRYRTQERVVTYHLPFSHAERSMVIFFHAGH